MTDTKDMRRSCLTIGDINWAQAHIDAQDAKIKALAETVRDLQERCSDLDSGRKCTIGNAALAAAKETT